MRNSQIALAVAGILAATAAGAANRNIYITGASAQRNFWVKDLVNICGAGAAETEFDGNLAAQDPAQPTFANPDFKAWQCVANAGAILPVASGDVVTMHYSAELGSVWGIFPGLYYATGGAKGVASHLFLEPNTTDCGQKTATASNTSGTLTVTTSVWNCPAVAAGTYHYNTDTIDGFTAAATLFDQQKPDLVTADVEPNKWQYATNWPSFTIFGAAPTATDLTTETGIGRFLTGQVFALITKGVPGNPTNISTESASSIFQGKYKTWSQVPEVGAADTAVGGTQIRVCRRDVGSGSGASASLMFIGNECGVTKTRVMVTNTGPGSGSLGAANVIINNTGGQVAACVTGTGANIGFATLAPSSTYTTMSLDGVEANAHNSAAGFYPFAYETWTADISAVGTSGASVGAGHVVDSGLIALFPDRVDTNSTLTNVLGAEAVLKVNGQYSTAAVTTGATGPKAYYSLASTGNTPSIANLENGATTTTVGSGIPISIFTTAGNSCSNLGNNNAN